MKKLGKGLILILFCVLFTGAGLLCIYFTRQTEIRTAHYVHTYGFVVDYREKWFSDNTDDTYDNYKYAPIIEYEVDGKVYTIYSDNYSSRPDFIGTPIAIDYDPENPDKAIIEKTESNIVSYIVGGLFVLIGPALLIAVIVMTLKDRKKTRKRKKKDLGIERDLSSESYYEGLRKL